MNGLKNVAWGYFFRKVPFERINNLIAKFVSGNFSSCETDDTRTQFILSRDKAFFFFSALFPRLN